MSLFRRAGQQQELVRPVVRPRREAPHGAHEHRRSRRAAADLGLQRREERSVLRVGQAVECTAGEIDVVARAAALRRRGRFLQVRQHRGQERQRRVDADEAAPGEEAHIGRAAAFAQHAAARGREFGLRDLHRREGAGGMHRHVGVGVVQRLLERGLRRGEAVRVAAGQIPQGVGRGETHGGVRVREMPGEHGRGGGGLGGTQGFGRLHLLERLAFRERLEGLLALLGDELLREVGLRGRGQGQRRDEQHERNASHGSFPPAPAVMRRSYRARRGIASE
ncbi:MAG: hypothetical protein IPJ28_08030 [Betaproteobacteria bacterium]|nr:hypothetical protein [Betaproteobacteria bacterium]